LPASRAAGRVSDRHFLDARTSNHKEPAMTLKLNHLHLKTRDPEKTVKFYVDNLGATIVNQSPRGGYRISLHGLELNVTKFLDDQKREQKYGMEHIAIDTDELDALVEKLKGQGINILEQTVVSGGRRVCFFEGPDGVQLEFIEMKK
jgi:catechol 2,3-dioxygenase-like lactoylglutathione lyase family enzyme